MTPAEIYCTNCRKCPPIADWYRAMLRVPVVHAGAVVGYVAVYRHRVCGGCTAVPVA